MKRGLEESKSTDTLLSSAVQSTKVKTKRLKKDDTLAESKFTGLKYLLSDSGVSIQEFMYDYLHQRTLLIQRNDLTFYQRRLNQVSLKGVFDLIKQRNKQSQSSDNPCLPLFFGSEIVCKYYSSSEQKEIEPLADSAETSVGDSSNSNSNNNSDNYSSTDSNDNDDSKSLIKPQVVSEDALKDLFENQGCTMQCHHWQHHCTQVHSLLHQLESELNCLVGSNIYITPPDSQGLAPHWDDIDVFVLQLEGSKDWTLYDPRLLRDRIEQARSKHGSQHLSELDITINPIQPSGDLPLHLLESADQCISLKCRLQAGDLLYFPRGTIHCAKSTSDQHSTHLTISSHQNIHWSRLLSDVMQRTIEQITLDNDESSSLFRSADFRECFPVDQLLKNFGFAQGSNGNDRTQECLISEMERKMDHIKHTFSSCLDECADQIAREFVSLRLPPPMMDDDENDDGKEEESESTMIKEGDCVVMTDPSSVRVLNEPSDDGSDCLTIYSCIHNDESLHLVGIADENGDEVHPVSEPLIELDECFAPMFDVLVLGDECSVSDLMNECRDSGIDDSAQFLATLNNLAALKVIRKVQS